MCLNSLARSDAPCGSGPGGDDFIRAKDLIERYAGPAVADVKVNKGFKLPVAV
jgi:hypothetical protein